MTTRDTTRAGRAGSVDAHQMGAYMLRRLREAGGAVLRGKVTGARYAGGRLRAVEVSGAGGGAVGA